MATNSPARGSNDAARNAEPDPAELDSAHVQMHLWSLQLELNQIPESELPEEARQGIRRVVAQYLEVKGSFEANRVRRESFDGTSLTLNVPEYPEAGQRMREMILTELKTAVPAQAPPRVMETLERFLDAEFQGFGANPRTFVVTPDPAASAYGGKPVYKLVQTIWATPQPGDIIKRPQSVTTSLLSLDSMRNGPFSGLGNAIREAYPAR